jgi:uncharacterized protein with HEPN domain
MNPQTEYRLKRILDFAKRIESRTYGISIETFLSDTLLQDAVVYCLGQIGENASKIDENEQEKYPDLFWGQMIGLRHRLFHEYEDINFSIVYEVTQEPINKLIVEIEKVLI